VCHADDVAIVVDGLSSRLAQVSGKWSCTSRVDDGIVVVEVM